MEYNGHCLSKSPLATEPCLLHNVWTHELGQPGNKLNPSVFGYSFRVPLSSSVGIAFLPGFGGRRKDESNPFRTLMS